MNEYLVCRRMNGGYNVEFGGRRIGLTFTLLGAKWIIWKHRRGKGYDTVAYRTFA